MWLVFCNYLAVEMSNNQTTQEHTCLWFQEQIHFVKKVNIRSVVVFWKTSKKNFKRIWTIIRLTWATDSIQGALRQILNRLQCIGLGKSPKSNWAKPSFGKFVWFWASLGKLGQAGPSWVNWSHSKIKIKVWKKLLGKCKCRIEGLLHINEP